MNSALHKSVSRKFWVGLLLTVVGLLVLLVLYPVVEGVLGWYIQPNVAYRGMNFKLPIGWVYSRSGLPLTVKKPSSILKGMQGDLWIHKTDITNENREAFVRRWVSVHSNANGFLASDDLQATYKDGTPVTVKCSRQVLPKGGGAITLDCLSGDAVWSFTFIGEPSDVIEAEGIMETILLQDIHRPVA
jgi:hypothetical protein